MKKIKVGCIGLGPRGALLFDLLMRNPNVEPYAVCDCSRPVLERYKAKLEKKLNICNVRYFTSHTDLINTDVEAVIIATHVSSHCSIAVDCLNAGKHVLCEIPNISNTDEAKKLYHAVKSNSQKKFMVAENCCYWAFIQSWKKIYDDGMIGAAIYAESDYLHFHEPVMKNGEVVMTWRSHLAAVKYLTHNLGPLLYILGDTCREVSGFVPDINPISKVHPSPPDGLAIIKTQKGTLIKLYIGFGVSHHFNHNFSLFGTRGSLEKQRGKLDDLNNTMAYFDSIPYTHKAIEIPIRTEFPNSFTEGHGGADIKMLEAFVDCILKDEKSPLDIEFGINIALPGIFADISSKHGGEKFFIPDISKW